MERQDVAAAGNQEEIQLALRRLLDALEVELAECLRSKRNFKVTINGSAGATFSVEVAKFVKLN